MESQVVNQSVHVHSRSRLLTITPDAVQGLKQELRFHIAISMSSGSPSAIGVADDRQLILEKTIHVAIDASMASLAASAIFSTAVEAAEPGRSALSSSSTPRRHVLNFLGLPLELRDKIYHNIIPRYLSHQDLSLTRESPCGLLFANKQIYNEFRDLLTQDTTYRLSFTGCANDCTCHLRIYEFDHEAASTEPESDVEIEVHSRKIEPVLAAVHINALQTFPSIEICWDMTHAGFASPGVSYVPRIVRAFAFILLRKLSVGRKKTVDLTIRWSYTHSNRHRRMSEDEHLARLSHWYKGLRSARLNLTKMSQSFKRDGQRYELIAKITVARK